MEGATFKNRLPDEHGLRIASTRLESLAHVARERTKFFQNRVLDVAVCAQEYVDCIASTIGELLGAH